MDVFAWFRQGKPPRQAGKEGVAEVYREVMEKHSLILREHANACLFDYYEAVLNEADVRLWRELMEGTADAALVKGGMLALGAQMEALRDLRRGHLMEHAQQIGEAAK